MLRTGIHRRGPCGRLYFAVVAYACLVAQLAAVAHGVLVQHVVCAEHGETVHLAAGAVRARDDAANATTRARWRLPARAAGVPVVAGDEHEHCSVVISSGLKPQAQLDAGTAPPPSMRGLRSPEWLGPGSRTATYLIAPKTSPPARA